MHPIFDSITLPFHMEEVRKFYQMLCQNYLSDQQIDNLYTACGALVTELPPLTNNQNPLSRWREALDNLSSTGRLKKLCDLLLEDAQANPLLKDAIGVMADMKPAIDPAFIDDSGLVILDRQTLREQLAALAKGSDPVKVLLVQGQQKSGKTYSRHLFEALARQRGATPVYLYSFVVVTLADVLESLFDAAGNKNAIPAGDTTVPGWHAKVCRQLLTVAKENKALKEMWIAIDDLGVTPDGADIMDKEIRDFFIQFVRHMSDSSFRQHFRLMLINYPSGKLPAGWFKEHYRQNDVAEQDITQQHIEDLVKNWSVARKKENFVISELEKDAKAIIDNCKPVVNPDDKPRLEQINDAVNDLLKKYKLTNA